MGTILYLVGLVCAVLAVLDIFKKNISTVGKVIASVLVLLTSWVGLLVYYFYAKDHLEEPRFADLLKSSRTFSDIFH